MTLHLILQERHAKLIGHVENLIHGMIVILKNWLIPDLCLHENSLLIQIRK